jgi:hypothetical protein
MKLHAVVAQALAHAFLGSDWSLSGLLERGEAAVGSRGQWLRPLAKRVLEAFPEPPLHRHEDLEDFVRKNESFERAWKERRIPHRTPRFLPFEPRMGTQRWQVPVLTTSGELARWLHLTPGELDWFADRRGLNQRSPLQHYRSTWIARGARLPRLLEAPKRRLRLMQRRLLDDMLARVPVHDAAHGFVSGRSALTHARLHTGQKLVVRFDLAHFFTSISAARAHGVFQALGYPREVATALLGLCTTRTPQLVLADAPRPEPFTAEMSGARFNHLRLLAEWHLPQGAPTSPALANLAAFGLDVRLSAFAQKRGLRYSRYADDLVFSGASVGVGPLHDFVRTVVEEEGFRLNEEKTRVMRAHQRQEVTGLVVNEKPNVTREAYDLIKARLHRCETQGPGDDADTLRSELQGQIAWVAMSSATRGAKLTAAFARVRWPSP